MGTNDVAMLEPRLYTELSGYRFGSGKKVAGQLICQLEIEAQHHRCPHCGSTRTLGYGKRAVSVRDIPLIGSPTLLQITRHRFKCRECLRTFYEPLPNVAEKHRATERLVSLIQLLALEEPYNSIAKQVGIDEKSVRNILRGHWRERELAAKIEPPVTLGVIEVILIDRPSALLVNLERGTIIGLLPSYSRRQLRNAVALIVSEGRTHRVVVTTEDSIIESVTAAVMGDMPVELYVPGVLWRLETSFRLAALATTYRNPDRRAERKVLASPVEVLTRARDQLTAEQVGEVQKALAGPPGLSAFYRAYQDVRDIVSRLPVTRWMSALSQWSVAHATAARRPYRWLEALANYRLEQISGRSTSQAQDPTVEALYRLREVLRLHVANRADEAIRALMLFDPRWHVVDRGRCYGSSIAAVESHLTAMFVPS